MPAPRDLGKLGVARTGARSEAGRRSRVVVSEVLFIWTPPQQFCGQAETTFPPGSVSMRISPDRE